MRTLALALGLALSGTLLVSAQPFVVGDLTIETPWARATAPGAQVGAGYLTIRNDGDIPDRLVEARSSLVPRVEIHSMRIADGVMEMESVPEGLEVPAGGSLELGPGSYHLMLMGLNAPLLEGETVPVTLVFETAGEIEVGLAIGSLGARGPATAHH